MGHPLQWTWSCYSVTCIYTYYNTLSPTNIANARSFGGVRSIFPDRVTKVPMLVEGGLTSNSSLQSKPSTLSAHPASMWKDPETNHTKAMKHDIFVYFKYHNLTWRAPPSFMQHVCFIRLLRSPGPHLEHTCPPRAFGTWRRRWLFFPWFFPMPFIKWKKLPEKLLWQLYTNHK